MKRSNRHWLPAYGHPDSVLPKVQETRTLFSRPPYAFQDFVGKAFRFLQGETARKIGFEYDPERTLPCKWKCSDEAVFGVDLAIYAQTGHYPFDKGKIGGYFNAASLGAAVHHGSINVDFGGSHVGYIPGEGGGSFGRIWRPHLGDTSTDCGHLMGLIEPFQKEFDEATQGILVYRPQGERAMVSVPNEFVQPHWGSRPVKLLVDTETLTDGEVDYDPDKVHTHTPIGRSLFYLHEGFLQGLSDDEAQALCRADPTPMGQHLSHRYFNTYDTRAALDETGLPMQRLLLYMKYIVSARYSPPALKVAIINTNIAHNRLSDTVREAAFRPYAFASFSGVFIDLFDEQRGGYVNLFEPLGLSLKPSGKTREIELSTEQIHHELDRLEPAPSVIPMKEATRVESTADIVDRFTFRPGHFRRA